MERGAAQAVAGGFRAPVATVAAPPVVLRMSMRRDVARAEFQRWPAPVCLFRQRSVGRGSVAAATMPRRIESYDAKSTTRTGRFP